MSKPIQHKYLSTIKKMLLLSCAILMVLSIAVVHNSNANSEPAPSPLIQIQNTTMTKVNYYVYEQNTDKGLTRCLSFSDPTKTTSKIRQTCYFLDDPDYLMFEYTRSIMGALMLNKAPEKILIIGLGGGTLLRAFRKILPNSHIHAVEISAEIIAVAKQHFSLKMDDKMEVFEEDGYSWMGNPSKGFPKYDLIVLDAFGEDYIPPQFLTELFVQKVKSRLNPDGVLAVNTFNNSPHAKLETKLYTDAFSKLYTISSANRILFAKLGQMPQKSELKLPPVIKEEELKKLGLTEKWLKSSMDAY